MLLLLGEWHDSLMRQNIGSPQQDFLIEDAYGNYDGHSQLLHLQEISESNSTESMKSAPMPASETRVSSINMMVDLDQMTHLRDYISESDKTQEALRGWDKLQGLLQTHSRTMLSTSRSRCQHQRGRILRKWNGALLIDDRPARVTKQKGKKQQMKRRRKLPRK